MIYILGISCYYHDSAACLMKDGIIIAAAQEERFTRLKHDKSFPINAIHFCLEYANISCEDLTAIAYYEKPIRKFERILKESSLGAPKGLRRFVQASKTWLKQKLWITSHIRKKLRFNGDILFSEHHLSHAASSFFRSNYKEACIITLDGVGEEDSVLISYGNNRQITPLKRITYPNSLGLFYSAFTQYCGFKVNSGEYKLMGLAALGSPIYKEILLEHVISISETGFFNLNQQYFNYRFGQSMTHKRLEKLLGYSPRKPESDILQFYKDIAASVQVITEEIICKITSYAIKITGSSNICLSGGVALNCVANQKVSHLKEVTSLHVCPASGDSGGAIGAALLTWHTHLDKSDKFKHKEESSISLEKRDTLDTMIALGPTWSQTNIEALLNKQDIRYHKPENISEYIAQRLTNKAVVGYFNGRMEFGPRALGYRSILASPIFEDMQHHLNLAIKKREGFRPFAPVVLAEKADQWFQLSIALPHKFMLQTEHCIQPETIPSCVHKDGSSRVQVLEDNEHPKLRAIIVEHERLTGVPVLINTSFNLRGEPIVCSPKDALSTFFNCEMDLLVLNDLVIEKNENEIQIKHWIKHQYELD